MAGVGKTGHLLRSLFRRSSLFHFKCRPIHDGKISKHPAVPAPRGIASERDGSISMSREAPGKFDSRKQRSSYGLKATDDDSSIGTEGEAARVVEDPDDGFFSQRSFEEFDISPATIKALTSAGYKRMTVVQEAALPACLDGKDVIVKSKAGNGKSLVFLLPVIEAVGKDMIQSIGHQTTSIRALVLCPTRELASQIAAEANVLLKYHDGLIVQTLVGGTRFKVDQQLLESNPPQIIVATPGRLLDHIENKVGFSLRLMGIKVLVIDEVDHLLDLGFRSDIEKIIDCLPRERKTLLYSATLPKEVRRISQLVLRRDHVYIDTVGFQGGETNSKVLQSFIVVPQEDQFEVLYYLLREHAIQEVQFKVIVFCTTAKLAALMYTFLKSMKLDVREMHSHKPQLHRTWISDEFKDSKKLILICSDVSDQRMNYPDITLVVQVGLPYDRKQYIHRLGRTAPGGKRGKSILLLAPWEEYFLDEIKDFPMEKCLRTELDSDLKAKVQSSLQGIEMCIKEEAFHAWLSYYNSIREIGRDKTRLVELANRFATSIGLEKTPALLRKTALKMGLKGIPGIRIM